MTFRKILFVIITMTFTFGLGPLLAHYSGIMLMEIVGVNLNAQPSMVEAIMLIVFLLFWYPIFCFAGLIVGLIVARPICGASVVQVLNTGGSFKIPLLSSIYNYVLYKLYQGNS